MTKTEIETIRNIVARLKDVNLGCHHDPGIAPMVEALNAIKEGDTTRERTHRLEVASRIYVDTWLIPSLEMLLPGEGRDADLAVRMSRR